MFLTIGILSFAAAGGLIAAKGRENPFGRTARWDVPPLSLQVFGRKIYGFEKIDFSPDGQKLVFQKHDDSGESKVIDTCLYLLDKKELRRLDVGNAIFKGWGADSRTLAFNKRRPQNPNFFCGFIYDIEKDAVRENFNVPFMQWPEIGPLSPSGKYQLFENSMIGARFVKEVGKPKWSTLPEETRGKLMYWSRDGNSLLLFCLKEKTLQRYDISTRVLHDMMNFSDFDTRIHPKIVKNDKFYFFVSGNPDGGTPLKSIQIFDMVTGRISYSYDFGSQSEEKGLYWLYVPPQDNALYVGVRQFRKMNGNFRIEAPRVVALNMATGAMETIFDLKAYFPRAYCRKRDVFVVSTGTDDHTALYLFDVKTRNIEKIFQTPSTALGAKE